MTAARMLYFLAKPATTNVSPSFSVANSLVDLLDIILLISQSRKRLEL